MFKAPNRQLYLALDVPAGINSGLMKQSHCVFSVLFSLLSCSAMAQWAWTDEEGRPIFSDRAPSTSVPEKRIFKRPAPPRVNPTPEPAPNEAAVAAHVKAASAALPAASTPQSAGLDKELAERKKKAEQAQAEQRKFEEERLSKLKADNCERARQAQRTLESGVRMVRTNARGEREILDDADRAVEAKRLQGIVATDCN
jgi:type IV secretory pathway VirB10-like protein